MEALKDANGGGLLKSNRAERGCGINHDGKPPDGSKLDLSSLRGSDFSHSPDQAFFRFTAFAASL
jgi:hypothetical protein